jgi:hypothetical protein
LLNEGKSEPGIERSGSEGRRDEGMRETERVRNLSLTNNTLAKRTTHGTYKIKSYETGRWLSPSLLLPLVRFPSDLVQIIIDT